MDHKEQEQTALHRWAVIAEAANARLTAAERGALVRQIAARAHAHPDGSSRRYSRGTIDRWLRAWRKGGLEALRPSPRADTGTVRAHPELFAEATALRLELPGRSAAQIARTEPSRLGNGTHGPTSTSLIHRSFGGQRLAVQPSAAQLRADGPLRDGHSVPVEQDRGGMIVDDQEQPGRAGCLIPAVGLRLAAALLGSFRTEHGQLADPHPGGAQEQQRVAVAALIAAAADGKDLIDDACAKKAVAELTRD